MAKCTLLLFLYCLRTVLSLQGAWAFSGTRSKSFSDAFKKYLERVPVKTPSSTFGTQREMLKNSLVPKKVYLLIIHFLKKRE